MKSWKITILHTDLNLSIQLHHYRKYPTFLELRKIFAAKSKSRSAMNFWITKVDFMPYQKYAISMKKSFLKKKIICNKKKAEVQWISILSYIRILTPTDTGPKSASSNNNPIVHPDGSNRTIIFRLISAHWGGGR